MNPFSFRNAARYRWNIAKDNPLFWWNGVFIGCTCWVILAWPEPVVNSTPSDLLLRVWGTMLQITGALIVWYDLSESATKHGRTSFVHNTVSWLKRLFGKPQVVEGSIDATLPELTVRAYGTVLPPPLPNEASIDERIAAMEKCLQSLSESMTTTTALIEKSETRLTQQINEHINKLGSDHSELKEALKDSIVGNYPKLVFGAVWAVIGMIISGIAPEISKAICNFKALLAA